MCKRWVIISSRPRAITRTLALLRVSVEAPDGFKSGVVRLVFEADGPLCVTGCHMDTLNKIQGARQKQGAQGSSYFGGGVGGEKCGSGPGGRGEVVEQWGGPGLTTGAEATDVTKWTQGVRGEGVGSEAGAAWLWAPMEKSERHYLLLLDPL